MPDTRFKLTNHAMLLRFTIGQGGQYNQDAAKWAYFVVAAGGRTWDGHVTITRADGVMERAPPPRARHLPARMVAARARRLAAAGAPAAAAAAPAAAAAGPMVQMHMVRDWHVTLIDRASLRQSAMHWNYDGVQDKYVCRGWKVTGPLIEPVIPAVEIAAAAIELAALPFFEGRTYPRDNLLGQLDAIGRKVHGWWGSRSVDDATWTTFR